MNFRDNQDLEEDERAILSILRTKQGLSGQKETNWDFSVMCLFFPYGAYRAEFECCFSEPLDYE